MANTYQEPIEKEDLDLKSKLTGSGMNEIQKPEKELAKEEKTPQVKTPEEKETKPSAPEGEAGAESREEKIGEKIETARKAIQAQKPAAEASVSDDAGTVSQIAEHEKKVEKLVELALQKGPEHAIRVAQHMDKGKAASETDNYTLDEIHDRFLEEDLRSQLIQKGLLKNI